ncbi:MAG TPA: TIGR03435 family protein [Acidobacteriaceae bacterium]|nr:TIGR03435 family protein [Acidobacteriaceae bacterium]
MKLVLAVVLGLGMQGAAYAQTKAAPTKPAQTTPAPTKADSTKAAQTTAAPAKPAPAPSAQTASDPAKTTPTKDAPAAAKRVEFAVATVKPAAPADTKTTAGGTQSTGAGSVSLAADRASYDGVTLKRLLMAAYDLEPFQISGPAWIETERYDVAATFPVGTPKDQIAVMLQHLIADRFQTSQHTEMKDEPVYLLRLGNEGPKLRPASSSRPQSAGFTISQAGTAQMRYIGYTLAEFAVALSNQVGRQVKDETGLPGKFDILLPVDAKDVEPGSISLAGSLLTAVKSVGLKLDAGKAPMKHLVVDTAQKVPTAN